jgi:CHAD domain-containing protein
MPTSATSRLLDRRLAAVLDALPGAHAGDARAVHQARVASRRLREALPMAGVSGEAGALRRACRAARRVTRALGPVRELDVALGHLDEVAARGLVPAAAIARVRQALDRQRQARRGHMIDTLTPSRLERLHRRLGELEATLAPPPADRTRAVEEGDRQIARRGRRLVEAIDRAGGLYLPDRLHAVRIAAKKLRYAIEVRQELARSRATRRIEALKRLQDGLGRMHDLEVLIEHIRVVQAAAAVGALGVSAGLDAVVRALEEECREVHARYMTERDGWLRLARSAAGA